MIMMVIELFITLYYLLNCGFYKFIVIVTKVPLQIVCGRCHGFYLVVCEFSVMFNKIRY